jgi:hypothetical protein
MRKQSWRGWLILLVLLIVPRLALSQAVQQSRTLIVNGKSGQVKVMEVDGRSYVDLESLARVANGTLGFSGNQITLTLPSFAARTASVAAPSSPPANSGFSKEFLGASIEEMAVIREWRSALVNSIENNFPIHEDWVERYRGQASTSLGLASVAASTDSDRSAVQLLSNEFDNMKALSVKLLAERKMMHIVSPENLNDDPLNQNILTCARSLASMAVGGQFVDDPSCH